MVRDRVPGYCRRISHGQSGRHALAVTLMVCLPALLGLAGNSATAATIYGSDDSNPAILYAIDTSTGATSAVGLLGFRTSAIAQSPRDFGVYHVDKTKNGWLTRWDPVTKTNTNIGHTGALVPRLIKLAFDSTGTLYGMGGDYDRRLYRLDTTTGVATLVGTVTGIEGSWGDIAFGPGDTLYLIDYSYARLYTVNMGTLAATFVGWLGFYEQAGLVYSGGYLYSAGDELVRVNPATGAGMRVAYLGPSITDLTTANPVFTSVNVSKAADPSDVTSGDVVTYTITVTNTGAAQGYISRITDVLPAGFTYVIGSTTGISTGDPSVNGQILEWNGSWLVPIGSAVELTFQATAGGASGTYYNNVTVCGDNFNAFSTGDTAPVTVGAPLIDLAKEVDKSEAVPGEELIYSVLYRNLGDSTAHTLFIVDTIPAHTSYVPGSLRIGGAGSTYATAQVLTDGPGDDEGEASGSTVTFRIDLVLADDGVPDSGDDEGKVYFKVVVQ